MTIAVNQTTTSKQYTCNAATMQFSFPNKIFAASDLVVTLIDLSGNLWTFPNQANTSLGLSYTVQNVDVDIGCGITFNTPPANGWTLDIRTVTPEQQTTSIKNQGTFFPELHEEFFDRATRMDQDLLRLTYTYGIHGPDIETTPWPALPNAAARAGLILAFNSQGLPTASSFSVAGVSSAYVAVGSYAALRALTPTSGVPLFATVFGANAPGDGGGGSYWYNSADVASADNGGTIIVSHDGGRWYLKV